MSAAMTIGFCRAQSTDRGYVATRRREELRELAFTTASTLLGVTRLGFSGQLVEVDLTAAL